MGAGAGILGLKSHTTSSNDYYRIRLEYLGTYVGNECGFAIVPHQLPSFCVELPPPSQVSLKPPNVGYLGTYFKREESIFPIFMPFLVIKHLTAQQGSKEGCNELCHSRHELIKQIS